LTKGAYSLKSVRKLCRIVATDDMAPRESPRPRPRERSHHHEKKRASRSHAKSRHESSSSQSGSQLLSANALARLDQLNHQQSVRAEEVAPKKTRRKRHREIVDEKLTVEKSQRRHKRKKRRVVSGALLEEGDGYRLRELRGGDKYEEYDDGKRKKRLCRAPPYLILNIQS
jgi:glucan 1,3-beta-glucosidase